MPEQERDDDAVTELAADAPAVAAGRSDLLSDLEVIESQPLARRAEAYEALHDTLARRLESGPTGAARP